MLTSLRVVTNRNMRTIGCDTVVLEVTVSDRQNTGRRLPVFCHETASSTSGHCEGVRSFNSILFRGRSRFISHSVGLSHRK